MRKLWIMPIIVVTALLFTGLGIYITKAQKPVQNAVNAPQPISVPLDANKILELVNAERAKVGVAPLVSDPRLVATAQSRADDMVARNYFSHNDPVTGESLVKIKASNPECAVASENIGANIDTVGDQNAIRVNSWMDSKPHHDAMLDAKYTLTGVAIAEENPNHFVAVQHFCQN